SGEWRGGEWWKPDALVRATAQRPAVDRLSSAFGTFSCQVLLEKTTPILVQRIGERAVPHCADGPRQNKLRRICQKRYLREAPTVARWLTVSGACARDLGGARPITHRQQRRQTVGLIQPTPELAGFHRQQWASNGPLDSGHA